MSNSSSFQSQVLRYINKWYTFEDNLKTDLDLVCKGIACTHFDRKDRVFHRIYPKDLPPKDDNKKDFLKKFLEITAKISDEKRKSYADEIGLNEDIYNQIIQPCSSPADKNFDEIWTELSNKAKTETENFLHSFHYNLRVPIDYLLPGIAYRIQEDQVEDSNPPPWGFFMTKGEKDENLSERIGGRRNVYKQKVVIWSEKSLDPENIEEEYSIVPEKFFGKKTEEDQIRTALLSLFISESSDIQEKYDFLLVPIHDIYIVDKGYGMPRGFITLAFDNVNFLPKETKIVATIIRKIVPILANISNEFFMSDIIKVQEAYSSREFDILKDFLSMFPYIQDWEKVSIKDGKDNVVSCWGYLEKNNANTVWNIEEWTELKNSAEPNNSKNYKSLDIEMEALDIKNFKPKLSVENIVDKYFSECHIECIYHKTALIPEERPKEMSRFEESIKERVAFLIRATIRKYLHHISSEQLAASAIMSRNMSHNIGSHVLAKIVSLGNKESDIVKLKDLLSYLQSRMDHLAGVATDQQGQVSHPVSFSFQRLINDLCSTSFKHFIEGKRSMDEHDRGQYFLCQYISGVMVDKEPLSVTIKIENEADDNVYVSVPNGNTGAHAFYIILENYIRNVAKHNTPKDGVSNFCVCMKIDDEVERYPDMIKISLWENLKKQETYYKDLVKRKECINNLIRQSIITEDLTPREEAWGIAEMVFSAQYLRQNEDEYKEKLPLLEAFISDSEGKKFFRINRI